MITQHCSTLLFRSYLVRKALRIPGDRLLPSKAFAYNGATAPLRYHHSRLNLLTSWLTVFCSNTQNTQELALHPLHVGHIKFWHIQTWFWSAFNNILMYEERLLFLSLLFSYWYFMRTMLLNKSFTVQVGAALQFSNFFSEMLTLIHFQMFISKIEQLSIPIWLHFVQRSIKQLTFTLQNNTIFLSNLFIPLSSSRYLRCRCRSQKR